MVPNYLLSKSINNKIFLFGLIYGRISFAKDVVGWKKKLAEYVKNCSAISAVSLNKNIFEKINLLKSGEKDIKEVLGSEVYKDYQAYQEAKEMSMDFPDNTLSLSLLIDLHSKSMHNGSKIREFRKSRRLLPKEVSVHGVVRQIELEVKTLPAKIPQKLESFITWFNESRDEENPIIMAAISHFGIAEIHPFEDGNGRLSRILEHFALKNSNINTSRLIVPEYYHLINSERYYDLLESSIESQELTAWIEFYTENLLNAITDTAKLIYQFTGGALDIINNSNIELTDLEEKVIAAIIENTENSSQAEIAKKLGYSRQNIYRTLRSLNNKGLLSKLAQITGIRYRIK